MATPTTERRFGLTSYHITIEGVQVASWLEGGIIFKSLASANGDLELTDDGETILIESTVGEQLADSLDAVSELSGSVATLIESNKQVIAALTAIRLQLAALGAPDIDPNQVLNG